jgi:hypothetical protein
MTQTTTIDAPPERLSDAEFEALAERALRHALSDQEAKAFITSSRRARQAEGVLSAVVDAAAACVIRPEGADLYFAFRGIIHAHPGEEAGLGSDFLRALFAYLKERDGDGKEGGSLLAAGEAGVERNGGAMTKETLRRLEAAAIEQHAAWKVATAIPTERDRKADSELQDAIDAHANAPVEGHLAGLLEQVRAEERERCAALLERWAVRCKTAIPNVSTDFFSVLRYAAERLRANEEPWVDVVPRCACDHSVGDHEDNTGACTAYLRSVDGDEWRCGCEGYKPVTEGEYGS